MLESAIGALGNRVDSKFLTAYWLPAFVLALGGFGILAGLVGFERVDVWISDLDSVEQGIGALILLLLISMLAFVLCALTRPIAEVFAGMGLPRTIADWSTRGQARTKARDERLLGPAMQSRRTSSRISDTMRWLGLRFPRDDADLKPTLFGNVVASAAEHPWRAYSMDGALWWSRLSPLVPTSFEDKLASAQAPLVALLNLCAIFLLLGLSSLLVLGPIGGEWAAAIATSVVMLAVSRVCYRAAMSQAVQVGSMLRVAFDLYRYDILDQLGLEHPSGLAAERELWIDLTTQMVGLPESAAGTTVPASTPTPLPVPAAPPTDALPTDPVAQT